MVAATPPHLLAIPAEKHDLHTCVLHSPPGTTGVNLFEAHPPTSELLLTCKTIMKEARGLFEYANKAYWQNTHFTIDRYGMISWSSIVNLRDRDLAHIRKLWIKTHGWGIQSNAYQTMQLFLYFRLRMRNRPRTRYILAREKDGMRWRVSQCSNCQYMRPIDVNRVWFLVPKPEDAQVGVETVEVADYADVGEEEPFMPITRKELWMMLVNVRLRPKSELADVNECLRRIGLNNPGQSIY